MVQRLARPKHQPVVDGESEEPKEVIGELVAAG
jgi:hypothetical protein